MRYKRDVPLFSLLPSPPFPITSLSLSLCLLSVSPYRTLSLSLISFLFLSYPFSYLSPLFLLAAYKSSVTPSQPPLYFSPKITTTFSVLSSLSRFLSLFSLSHHCPLSLSFFLEFHFEICTLKKL